MESRQPFSARARLQSFKHALNGLADILRTEHNAWLHGGMTVLVLALAVWLRLAPVKFALIVLAVISVWVAEAFNTVCEVLADMASPATSVAARRAKDIAAAAVLIASLGAAAVGVIILLPALMLRFASG
jgi:diacylglycerol kinase (ATP)